MKKDIYELLNDVTVDEADFEEIEVTEMEKARLKKILKNSLPKKKSKWKKPVFAAAAVLCLSTATFGLAFPTYASQVPIIGDIFRFLDNDRTGLYDNYKEYANELNVTKKSNGVKITVNDAVFDGKTITLTYSLESEKDLGESPSTFDNVDVKGEIGATWGAVITKVEENKYVGLMRLNPYMKEGEMAEVNWTIKEIITDTEMKSEIIKGNWNFKFQLKATERDNFAVNKSIEQNGIKVGIDKIMMTPMSFTVDYNQEVSESIRGNWDDVYVEIEIKDDLGNIYAGENNGGSGDSGGYNMNWSKTFMKLDKEATKLIITPHVSLMNYGKGGIQGGGTEILENGGERSFVTTSANDNDIISDERKLDDIVIELKK
ncbi:DUF4179 domain-containing protein [Metabacillus fastidiosus]|uniref:DUF4179 domain-containing protein n=1 Tax=Metabacillus fastidiosus TaxID=1458 RepID=UPI002DC063BB|nr:DUF4179 domain-containing protein [Metabacillus fastidiosus]MEC2077139.1 DUF4179 domain-containing protein [Metabacillus fastidiosus]